MSINAKRIQSFTDLDVYNNSYDASIVVARQLLTQLPVSERFDLKDQLSRSTKAIPRLIAEGFAKKHQARGFQKYIDDAMAECNETIVGISQVRDLYRIEPTLCDHLIDCYDKSARQLYNLALAWDHFKRRDRTTQPNNDTGCETV